MSVLVQNQYLLSVKDVLCAPHKLSCTSSQFNVILQIKKKKTRGKEIIQHDKMIISKISFAPSPDSRQRSAL